MTVVKIKEAYKPDTNPVGAILTESADGRIRREITIITAGWGSSGYYATEMLKEKGSSTFPAGTHMYMDHPTKSEQRERPERSVKDLAAVYEEDARWSESAQGLVTVAEIFPNWKESLTHEGFVNAIGTSIIAYGESEMGEAEGRNGPIITLTEGLSTDFVTHAGAGGEVGKLIEAARKNASWPIDLKEARNAADWLAAYIHSCFTNEADYLFGEGYLSRDERVALSSAIGDALDAFNESISANIPQLLTRDPYGEPGTSMSLETTRPQGEEDTMDEETRKALADLGTRVSEAETKATDAETRAEAAEKERDDLKKESERDRDRRLLAKAKEVAKDAVEKVKGLPERAVERAVKDSFDPSDLPLDSKGELIESTIKEKATEAAEAEKKYLNGASSEGRVRENGQVTESSTGSSFLDIGGSEETETKEAREALERTFQGMGMSESAAKIAAEGR